MRDYGIAPQVWGGSSDCDHEWGDDIPGDNRGNSGTPNGRNNRGEEYNRSGPKGKFCTKCNAWLGSYGNEPRVEQYVAHTLEIFDALGHALRDDGVIWWNLGSTYAKSEVPEEEHVMRDDLTSEERAYVLAELAKWQQSTERSVQCAADTSTDNRACADPAE